MPRSPAKTHQPRRSVASAAQGEPKPRQPRRRRAATSKAAPLDAAAVARQLLDCHAGPDAAQAPTLYTRAAFARGLSVAARRSLDPALAHLGATRELLALRHGRSQLYLFAAPLAAWLAGKPNAPSSASPWTTADKKYAAALMHHYGRLVRESGGFPDVAIAALLAAFGADEEAGNLTQLHAALIYFWKEGCAVFSLGDWSLATSEARAAALPLAGEHYLLVRLLPPDPAADAVRNV
ncbi:MAG: hypothetical protein JO117_07590 [Verrucomicrobia bacterium]|nr:hypothetical protein [Verrucomicrobiota bacterium]MBV9657392.1 hypothetical protein [Verrucomicrobiota bacterium]